MLLEEGNPGLQGECVATQTAPEDIGGTADGRIAERATPLVDQPAATSVIRTISLRENSRIRGPHVPVPQLV